MKKLLVLLLIPLIGCSRPIDGVSVEDKVTGVTNSVSVVTMEDGTRCALYATGYAGGIHCDWKTDD